MPRASIVFLAIALLAAPAAAERPSLNKLNADLNLVEETLCIQADLDGKSYRPVFCDAECGCLSEAVLDALESCSETGPGTLEAVGSELAAGFCVATGPSSNQCLQLGIPEFPTVGACESSSATSCTSNAQCPAGEECLAGWGIPFCALGCNTTLQNCPAPDPDKLCDGGPLCETQADCEAGDQCLLDPNGSGVGLCTRSCDVDADCSFARETRATLAGVGGADDPAPASCSSKLPEQSAGEPVPINNRDAAACRSQIELRTGPCQ